MKNKPVIILGIESSCDDTAAAILKNGHILSNVIANQKIHQQYGGVVPELASKNHQQNIIPVVNQAIAKAGINLEDISAVAFTKGPGLMGSLLVGVSFAKSFAFGRNLPLIDVNHMQGHVMAHFIKKNDSTLTLFSFFMPHCFRRPYSNHQGKRFLDFELLGETIDDAAGEAFDKSAKILGLPYPGGPLIDKLAEKRKP